MKEVWKDIPGYEGLYQVSNLGRVKSLERVVRNPRYKSGVMHQPEKIKTPSVKNGYLKLSLHNDGISKNYYLHRLVADAFIPNPDNKEAVNHINGNKLDNKVENLEWTTAKENVNHAIITGLSKTNQKNQKSSSKPVAQYDRNMNLIKIYPSMKEAERETGISHSSISWCCSGRFKVGGGYIWKYA